MAVPNPGGGLLRGRESAEHRRRGERRTPADTAGAAHYHRRWAASALSSWAANEGLRLAFRVTSCGDGTNECSIRYLIGGQTSGTNPDARTGDYYR